MTAEELRKWLEGVPPETEVVLFDEDNYYGGRGAVNSYRNLEADDLQVAELRWTEDAFRPLPGEGQTTVLVIAGEAGL